MAKTERQRQKKLAKKKSQQLKQRRESSRRKNELASLSGKIRTAAGGRVAISCYGNGAYEPMGMVPVYFGRYNSAGQVVLTVWLLDNACLGVKDAFCRTVSKSEMDELIDQAKTALVEAPPESVLSLIKQSVEFAKDIGIPPKPDVTKLLRIFGDVDSTKCKESFAFGGPDGRPVYIPGPYDGPETVRRVSAMLTAAAESKSGEDLKIINYHSRELDANSDEQDSVDADDYKRIAG